MTREKSELTDIQWAKIAPLLPKAKPSPKGGRTPIDNRPVFEGILWVARWCAMEGLAQAISFAQHLLATIA